MLTFNDFLIDFSNPPPTGNGYIQFWSIITKFVTVDIIIG
jgi:hypothetical protein